MVTMKQSAFENFGEGVMEAVHDFARCQRPDGSFYGTSGQCRKGSPAQPKEKESSKKSLGTLEGSDAVFDRLFEDDKVGRAATRLVKEQSEGSISGDQLSSGLRQILTKAGYVVKISDADMLDEVISPLEDRVL